MILRTVLLTLIALVIVGTPARAEIRIEAARITQGYLVIAGRAASANLAIVLDESHNTTSDSRGRFRFEVVYVPASCIATLRAGSDIRRVVIANCAPRGEPGPQGPQGDPGPQGPKGDPGLQGTGGDSRPHRLSAGSKQQGRTGDAGVAPPPDTSAAARGLFIENAIGHSSIFFYLAALAVYSWARPSWRSMGPSLSDSFVFGLALFASGSILVWLITGVQHSFEVLLIGLIAGISGTLAAALWSLLLSSRIAELRFFKVAAEFRATRSDQLAITVGLGISALVCLLFLVQAFSHEHVRSLLAAAIVEGKPTLNQARLIMSAGTEGYFAPGFVKQFRDVLIPLLCTAALLCHGSYNNKPVFYGALFIAVVAMFISGQRLVLIELMLCLGAGFLLDLFRSSQRRLMPVPLAMATFVGIAGVVGLMTQMLGRADTRLLPIAERPMIQAPPHLPREEQTETPERQAMARGREAVRPDERAAAPERERKPLHPQSKPRDRSDVALPLAVPVAVAHRSVMAVPQENAVSYPIWGARAPAFGEGWWTELSSMRPGTQFQLSNELSQGKAQVKGSAWGNSPLGMPTDLYYNWGFAGVIAFTALYALALLLLDIAFIRSMSALLYSAKLLLFFSIPFMYSPFLFVLYGGAAVLALSVYVFFAGNYFRARSRVERA